MENNNKLIAEFIRGEIVPETWTWSYHKSWDSLMPVIEKIASNDHKTEIVSDEETDNCKITVYVDGEYNHMIFQCGLSTLEATHKAVVEFIKWYNKNK